MIYCALPSPSKHYIRLWSTAYVLNLATEMWNETESMLEKKSFLTETLKQSGVSTECVRVTGYVCLAKWI